MELRAFLQSGLLESYALGQCSASERILVEKMLAEHEAARTELQNIEIVLEQFAQTQAVTPPVWMKGRIEDLVRRESDTVRHLPPNSGNGYRGRFWLNGFLLMLAASLLAAAAWWQTSTLKQELGVVRVQLDNCEKEKSSSKNLQQQIAHVNDPDTRADTVKWLQPDVHPEATAIVYYNERTRKMFVDQYALPPLPPRQTYQLWVVVDGKDDPIPLDLLSAADHLAATITFSGTPVGFAISVEPAGGSPNGKPTTMVMYGKAG